MKDKSQKIKVKSKEKNTGFNTALIAALLTVFFHGVVFSVPALFIYADSKGKSQNSKVIQTTDTVFVDVALLPSISVIGEASAIEENKGGKTETAAKEAGLNGQAEKKGDASVEKEMLVYQDMIKQKIQQARRYPAEARQKGIEGGVEIAFTVQKQGALKGVEIQGTSGSDVLDNEAVATIKRASPFPEIPGDINNHELTMYVKIRFNLE